MNKLVLFSFTAESRRGRAFAEIATAQEQFTLSAKDWEGNWLRPDIKVYMKD